MGERKPARARARRARARELLFVGRRSPITSVHGSTSQRADKGLLVARAQPLPLAPLDAQLLDQRRRRRQRVEQRCVLVAEGDPELAVRRCRRQSKGCGLALAVLAQEGARLLQRVEAAVLHRDQLRLALGRLGSHPSQHVRECLFALDISSGRLDHKLVNKGGAERHREGHDGILHLPRAEHPAGVVQRARFRRPRVRLGQLQPTCPR